MTDNKLARLAEPFPAELIEWRPGGANKDKTKAQALPYTDPRHYQDRLNEVLGTEWCDDRQIHFTPEKVTIVVEISTGCTRRSGVGEASLTEQFRKDNAVTIADAQAFKRACTEYGLGRYLYDWPRVWEDYDSQKRRFTKEAQQRLGQRAKALTAQTLKKRGKGGGGLSISAATEADEQESIEDVLATPGQPPRTDKGAAGAADWIRDEAGRKRFLEWTRDKLDLSNGDVCEGLKVPAIDDYGGTKAEAHAAIMDYITRQVAAAAAEKAAREEGSSNGA